MNGFLAFILPVGGGGHVDNSLPGGGNYPSHPIAPGGGGSPPGIWGGGNQPWPTPPMAPGGGGGEPSHPIYLPPPGINIPVFPSNPIAPGGGEGGEVTNPIGGGYVLVFHPSFGWIAVPVGGLAPVGGGGGGSGSGNKPTQPIQPTPTPKS